MSRLSFTEKMRGSLRIEGSSSSDLHLLLTIDVADIDRFLDGPERRAELSGFVHAPALGGSLRIERGEFHLFPADELGDPKIGYQIDFLAGIRSENGALRRCRLEGAKRVGPGLRNALRALFHLPLTLRMSDPPLDGSDQPGELADAKCGEAEVHLRLRDLSELLGSVDVPGSGTLGAKRLGILWRIAKLFVRAVVAGRRRARPARPVATPVRSPSPLTPHRVLPFRTKDGLELLLRRFQSDAGDGDDVVLLVHGHTSAASMFYLPDHEQKTNLVSHLHASGFSDVWCLESRMSGALDHNARDHRFSLDDVALYDYPAALECIRNCIDPNQRIHVVAHCLGAMTILMSLFAGQVEVTSVVANSVGLTPHVPRWARVKLALGPGLFENVLRVSHIDPNWGNHRPFSPARIFSRFVSLWHRRGCDVSACHMSSFMWGAGTPALFEHENMSRETHARIGELFGRTNWNYHRHVHKMVSSGHRAVKLDPGNPRHRDLPNEYLDGTRGVTTPILLVSGDRNRVFADSNRRFFEELVRRGMDPRQVEFKSFARYGHQDVFMGENAAVDVFDELVRFLKGRGRS